MFLIRTFATSHQRKTEFICLSSLSGKTTVKVTRTRTDKLPNSAVGLGSSEIEKELQSEHKTTTT